MKPNKYKNLWRTFLATLLLTLTFGANGQPSVPKDAYIGQCSLGNVKYGSTSMTRGTIYLIAVDGNKMGSPRSNQQYLIGLKVYDLPKSSLPAMNQKYRDKGMLIINPEQKLWLDKEYQIGTLNIDYQGSGKYSYLYFAVADYLLASAIVTSFLDEVYYPISELYYYTDKGEKVTFTVKPDPEDPKAVYKDYKKMYSKILDYWDMPRDMINDF